MSDRREEECDDEALSRPASTTARPLTWLLLFIAVALLFYGLDHGVMALQGLPLNPDLSPAQ